MWTRRPWAAWSAATAFDGVFPLEMDRGRAPRGRQGPSGPDEHHRLALCAPLVPVGSRLPRSPVSWPPSPASGLRRTRTRVGRPPPTPARPLPPEPAAGASTASNSWASGRPAHWRAVCGATMAEASGWLAVGARRWGGQLRGCFEGVEPFCGLDAHHRRLAQRQCAGLVHEQRVDQREHLEGLGVADDDPKLRPAPGAETTSGHRRCQPQGARTGNDEHGHRVDEGMGQGGRGAQEQPEQEGQAGQAHDHRHEVARDLVRQPLDARAGVLRLADQPDDLGEHRVLAHAFGDHHQGAGPVQRAAHQACAGHLLRGTDLPVTIDLSTALRPDSTSPSIGMRIRRV